MVSAVLIQKSNIVEANNICLSPGECQGGIPVDSKIIARWVNAQIQLMQISAFFISQSSQQGRLPKLLWEHKWLQWLHFRARVWTLHCIWLLPWHVGRVLPGLCLRKSFEVYQLLWRRWAYCSTAIKVSKVGQIRNVCLGLCLGPTLGATVTNSAQECLALCHQRPNCEWYTFFAHDGGCFLTTDCDFIDETCSGDCWHGKRGCDKSGELQSTDNE